MVGLFCSLIYVWRLSDDLQFRLAVNLKPDLYSIRCCLQRQLVQALTSSFGLRMETSGTSVNGGPVAFLYLACYCWLCRISPQGFCRHHLHCWSDFCVKPHRACLLYHIQDSLAGHSFSCEAITIFLLSNLCLLTKQLQSMKLSF